MKTAIPTAAAEPRLRIDPSFVQAQTLDGRPYIAKDAEPYTQFWLSRREQGLLAQFAQRRGATADEAARGWLRAQALADVAPERQRIARAIRGMRAAGVLLAAADDSSRYDAAMAADYIAQRPFPQPLVAHIAERSALCRASRVLDLAGGPGDLALALARHSDQVSLMELSRGFLDTAARRARVQGLSIDTVHDSCNRLVHHQSPQGEGYDLVTVAQALHWLDDVAVCRGVCRLLRAGGSFFVVHAAMQVDDDHPLAHLLGYDSVLGAHPRIPFADEVQPLLRRQALLFEALDAPDVHRFDPTHGRADSKGSGTTQRIGPAGVTLFRQRRPFGPGFVRGFFTPRHIEATGMTPHAFRRDVQARCAARPAADCDGIQHWAVLHFQRGAPALSDAAWREAAVREIAFDGPGAA